jgi:hypothetical protein
MKCLGVAMLLRLSHVPSDRELKRTMVRELV